MTYDIFITELAKQKAKDYIINNKEKTYLRLGVAGAGCQGMSYVIRWEEDLNKEKDLLFMFGDVKLIIDNKSIKILNQCTLDYRKSLIKQEFIIKNPSEKSSCGCGNSFNI